MEGYKEYFCNGQFSDLVRSLDIAQELDKESVSLKIDGTPAIVAWNDFSGLQPGVAFKTIFRQIEKGIAEEGKHFFTSEEQIVDFMESKRQIFSSEESFIHRTDAFLQALRLTQYLKPGFAYQMDTLWSNRSEIDEDETHVFVKPNTISYGISKERFPAVKSAKFGAMIHTSSEGGTPSRNSIFREEPPSDFCIFTKEDFTPVLKSEKEHNEINSLLEELCDLIEPAEKAYKPDLKSILKKAIKNSSGIEELRDSLDFEGSDVLIEFFSLAQQINNKIAKNYIVPGIDASGVSDDENEGLVIKTPDGLFKVVSDDFTAVNVEHIRRVKESKLDKLFRLNERIESNGKTFRAWSSSKSPDLFDYYFKRQLQYGLGGGSNFGFATYLTTEPPFTEAAQVGYSDDYRKKLYGENIFEFTIDTKNIFFFDFNDYLLVNPAATPGTFIKEQVEKILKMEYTPEIASLLEVADIKSTTSGQALGLFKLLSRTSTQSADGTLRAPIDGFEYRGKNDGKVLVVWNSYALIPERLSNDSGKTWKEIDKSSPEYQEYLEASKKGSYSEKEEERKAVIFGGKVTPEKEKVYRLLMAYNSNDTDDTKMADGIFFDIKINDNSFDAKFRYNLPYVDCGLHYFRLRKNQFIDKIHKLGFKIGKLTCDGIKVGGDSGKDWTLTEVPDYYWPESCTGHLKLVNHSAEQIVEGFDLIKTDLQTPKLVLRNCEISSSVIETVTSQFSKIETESTSKPCYCDSTETYKKLLTIKEFNIPEGTVVSEKPTLKRR